MEETRRIGNNPGDVVQVVAALLAAKAQPDVRHVDRQRTMEGALQAARWATGALSPHFSPGFVARRRRRAWIQGAAEGTRQCVEERNAVNLPVSARRSRNMRSNASPDVPCHAPSWTSPYEGRQAHRRPSCRATREVSLGCATNLWVAKMACGRGRPSSPDDQLARAR